MTTAPFQPGQPVELEITDIAFGGDGIGRVDGFVVFVPFVALGERVQAEIVEVKKRFATARLIKVLTPSPQRVDPRCDHYGRCAGCQYQHIDYPEQLRLKQKQIVDIFERLGRISQPPVEPVVASPQPYGYRNKIVVHGPGRPGFWAVGGGSIIEIDRCPIARDEINTRLAEVSGQLLEHTPHLTLRANADGKVWTFTEPNSELPIDDRVLGRDLTVPLGSFFQVNHGVIERVLAHVRQLFQASDCRTLVDAYCGIGLFALLLADLAEQVYGMEVDEQAVAAAGENARAMKLTNTDFYPGQTERLLFYTLRQCDLDRTCLLLDPPRSGCGKAVLKTLRKTQPRKILYVSCAPAMLARDVKALIAAGYRLERITPFDMFPQTKHCEAVAELARDEKN